MKRFYRSLDFLWLLLMGITLVTTAVAENAAPGLWMTVVVAVVVAIKGRLVVDHFMELRTAKAPIRHLMNAYFYVFPTLIVLASLYPERLKEWTTL